MPVNMPDNLSRDRIMNALLDESEQEARVRVRQPTTGAADNQAVQLRRAQYQNILDGYVKKKDLTADESRSLRFVRGQIGEMTAKLYPTTWNKIRYWKPVKFLVNWIRGRASKTNAYSRQIEAVGKQTAQVENVKALQETLHNQGFNVSMEGPLSRWIAHELPAFHLEYYDPDNRKTQYTLFFKKIPGTDTYAFTQYNAEALRSAEQSMRDRTPLVREEVSMLETNPYTAKEAENLVHQQPVSRMQAGQERWAWLDQHGHRQQTTVSLVAKMAQYLFDEQQIPVKWESLLAALRSGNTKEATLIGPDKKTEKVTVQFDPIQQDLVFTNKAGQAIQPPKKHQLPAATIRMMEQALYEKPAQRVSQGRGV
ncbi:hypothetical protein [Dinghuibacter silviterrae]|uniref:Uncharacterized protein n=1 Tax=Dinghuibacter silviterrae TaxID=1539049 RepID=A0A4R8DHC3_9BACT|nr:hypothetical protein [Dinghuibacter silviterrae]TDW97113.1 hypothetical protein EDB95_4954 [Dinghuibacter silviterrae]